MYWSRNDGETFRTLAMLSKPSLRSSSGSSVLASTRRPKKIVDRVSVFGAVHPVQGHTPRDSDVRLRRDPAKFRARRRRNSRRLFRLARAGRRHHPAAKFPYGFFPDFASLPTSARFIVSSVRPAVLRPLVVARHAVLSDEFLCAAAAAAACGEGAARRSHDSPSRARSIEASALREAVPWRNASK